MATAARGHGMMLRVQQLEAEFPSIEKALLSQTNQTGFAQNTGLYTILFLFSPKSSLFWLQESSLLIP